jgi:hypothetical protein
MKSPVPPTTLGVTGALACGPALLVLMWMTTTAPGAASEGASIGPLKRSRIGAVVEKPSRALTASCSGFS